MKPADPIDQTEAAEILGCSRSTVARMVHRGELTSHGTHPSLSRAEVQEATRQRRRYRLRASEAAARLEVSLTTVHRWLATGSLAGVKTTGGQWRLDPVDVWRVRTEGPELVQRSEAARILGVSPGRVDQLAKADLIPVVEVPVASGKRRRYRRRQLEVVANAREARWH